jgi:hypothetical protein
MEKTLFSSTAEPKTDEWRWRWICGGFIYGNNMKPEDAVKLGYMVHLHQSSTAKI